MVNKEINWKQIIVTILLTGVVTVATSLLLDWYRSEEPKLIYSTTESLPFEGKDNYFGIYHVKIENQGKNPISDISSYINIPSSLITDRKILIDPSINYTERLQNDTYILQAQYLNPKDSVEISLLVIGKNKLPAEPVLSIRGKGVNGNLQSSTSQNNETSNPLIPLFFGLAALSASLFSVYFRSKKSSSNSDKQNHVLAYLCRINGLIDEANKYLESTWDVTYWAEADNLGYIASIDTSQEKKEKTKKLLLDLIDYKASSIADSSKGIIYYNIARIELSQGNLNQAVNNLKEARKFSDSIIDKRV